MAQSAILFLIMIITILVIIIIVIIIFIIITIILIILTIIAMILLTVGTYIYMRPISVEPMTLTNTQGKHKLTLLYIKTLPSTRRPTIQKRGGK